VSEGDPDTMLAVLERKAELADKMKAAIQHLIVNQTYPEDWTNQGNKACLGSAGAERIGRMFPIKFTDVEFVKEDATDANGTAYRYVYRGFASLYERIVYVEGTYSTRDKFLGFKAGEWKPVEDINEGHIRSAAYHVFQGNAVKALLGIRNLPWEEYMRIMEGTGQDPGKTQKVKRGSGTQGGTSAKDSDHQKELAETCIEFANAGMTVEKGPDDKFVLTPISDGDDREPLDIAKAICIALSGFDGKDGPVEGKLASQLKGKWLNATIGKVRKLKEQLEKS
jgi:hypothetical protein